MNQLQERLETHRQASKKGKSISYSLNGHKKQPRTFEKEPLLSMSSLEVSLTVLWNKEISCLGHHLGGAARSCTRTDFADNIEQ